MTEFEEKLNNFLVEVFNDVLRIEEASLDKAEFSNLTISEMHVIEAAVKHSSKGEITMARLAQKLCVTAGTATTAVKTLCQKGYLQRAKAENDKRKVVVTVTEKGMQAQKNHLEFHENFIKSVSSSLTTQETQALASALDTLHNHFKSIAI